jgi:hypothetical protein
MIYHHILAATIAWVLAVIVIKPEGLFAAAGVLPNDTNL